MLKRGRFIAGAVCRECGVADRIIVEDVVDGRRQRCVACDATEAIHVERNTDASKARQPAPIAASRVATILESSTAGRHDQPTE